MNKRAFIIPTHHISGRIADVLVEAQAFHMSIEDGFELLLDAAQHNPLTDWGHVDDVISNGLGTFLSDPEDSTVETYATNDVLRSGLCELERELRPVLEKTIWGGSHQCEFPTLEFDSMTMEGDLVIREREE